MCAAKRRHANSKSSRLTPGSARSRRTCPWKSRAVSFPRRVGQRQLQRTLPRRKFASETSARALLACALSAAAAAAASATACFAAAMRHATAVQKLRGTCASITQLRCKVRKKEPKHTISQLLCKYNAAVAQRGCNCNAADRRPRHIYNTTSKQL